MTGARPIFQMQPRSEIGCSNMPGGQTMAIYTMAFDHRPELDPDERSDLDRESGALEEMWHREIVELDWRMWHDLPESFYGVLREYEERGAPLGDPFKFLPSEIQDVYVLRRFGTAEQLAQQVEALEGMETPLLVCAHYQDFLAFDRFWSRLTTLRGMAEAAEERLRSRGYSVNPETHLLAFEEGHGRPTKWGNAAIRRAYRHMKPAYEVAWPEDLHCGQPTKNPRRLRGHIAVLLQPWIGRLADKDITTAIDNG